jgi:peptidoglycan hydrolase CwlO-like protein
MVIVVYIYTLFYNLFESGVFINKMTPQLNDYQGIKAVIDELNLRVGNLEAKDKSQDVEINELKNQNNEFKVQNSKLNGEINEIKKKNNKLREDIFRVICYTKR